MRQVSLAASALLLPFALTAALAAQQDKPKPAFHLPAGDYALAELIDQAQTAYGRPIAHDADQLKEAVAPRVRLQSDLQLDAAGWEDALSSLLYARGLVLVWDAATKRGSVQALTKIDGAWLREHAEVRTLEQLAKQPHRCGPVRVTVQFPMGANLAQNMLRPLLMAQHPGVTVSGDQGALTLCGMHDLVLVCLRTLAGGDPQLGATLAGASAAPAWPRPASATKHELAAGKITPRELIDRFARELHRNVLVVDEDLATAQQVITVDKAATALDDFAFEDAVTSLLWDAGVLLLGTAPEHGLYEAITVNGPRTLLALRCTQPMAANEVAARPQLVAFVSVALPLQRLSVTDVANAMRGVFAAQQQPGLGTTMAATSEHSVALTGRSNELSPLLASLLARDAAK